MDIEEGHLINGWRINDNDLTRRIPWTLKKADLVEQILEIMDSKNTYGEELGGQQLMDDKSWGDNNGVGPDYAQSLNAG